MTVEAEVTRASVVAAGHRVSYLHAGRAGAPVVVLLHGLASDSETWDRCVAPLAQRGLEVFALDLIGHGRSDKPRRSYLLDDFADSLRDTFDALGIASATVCGHSLGGAIGAHFGYRSSERVERLVLVSAGGLGREVHPVLRAAALPVALAVLRLFTRPGLRRLYGRPRLHRMLRLTPDNITNLRRAGRALGSADGQAAFFASLRGAIAPTGQRGTLHELGALRAEVPTLIVWSEIDPVLPVAHAYATRDLLPGSRLVIFPGRGHEPHRRDVERFADEVASFVGVGRVSPGEIVVFPDGN